jgi:hypothetical protein
MTLAGSQHCLLHTAYLLLYVAYLYSVLLFHYYTLSTYHIVYKIITNNDK